MPPETRIGGVSLFNWLAAPCAPRGKPRRAWGLADWVRQGAVGRTVFANGAICAAFERAFNAESNQVKVAPPRSNQLFVVIDDNAMITGDHAGMWLGNELYDPGGHYEIDGAHDDPNFRANFMGYVTYELEDGPDVRIFRFTLNKSDVSTLEQRLQDAPGAPLFCATDVQNTISGVGPFSNIGTTRWVSPAGLARELNALTTGKNPSGSCVRPDGSPC